MPWSSKPICRVYDTIGNSYNIHKGYNKYPSCIYYTYITTLLFASMVLVWGIINHDVPPLQHYGYYNNNDNSIRQYDHIKNHSMTPLQSINESDITLSQPAQRNDNINLTISSSSIIESLYVTATISTLDPCSESVASRSQSDRTITIPMDQSPQNIDNQYIYTSRSNITWDSILFIVTRCAITDVTITLYNDINNTTTTPPIGTRTFTSTDTSFIPPQILLSRTYYRSNVSNEKLNNIKPDSTTNVAQIVYYHGYNPYKSSLYIYIAGFLPLIDYTNAITIQFFHPDLSQSACSPFFRTINTSISGNNPSLLYYTFDITYGDILDSCGTNYPSEWGVKTTNPVSSWSYTLSWNIPSTDPYYTYLLSPDTSLPLSISSLNTITYSYDLSIFTSKMAVKNVLTGQDSGITPLPFEMPIAGSTFSMLSTINSPYKPLVYPTTSKYFLSCTLGAMSIKEDNDNNYIIDRYTILNDIPITRYLSQNEDVSFIYQSPTTILYKAFRPDSTATDIDKQNYANPTLFELIYSECVGSQEFPIFFSFPKVPSSHIIQFPPTKAISYIKFTPIVPYTTSSHRIALSTVWFYGELSLTISFKGKYTLYNDNTIYTFDAVYSTIKETSELIEQYNNHFITTGSVISYIQLVRLIIPSGSIDNINNIYDIIMTVALTQGGESLSTQGNLASLCQAGYTGVACQQDIQCIDVYMLLSQCSHGRGTISYNSTTQSCDTECICQPGYTGHDCSQEDVCSAEYNLNNQCSKHGYISYDIPSGQDTPVCSTVCTCNEGWMGDQCDIPIYCSTQYNTDTYINQCYNHGFTYYGDGYTCNDMICSCDYGFMDSNCSKTFSCPLAKYNLQITHQCTSNMVYKTSLPDTYPKYCTAQCGCRGPEWCNNHGFSPSTLSPDTNQYECISTSQNCQCDDNYYGEDCRQYGCENTYNDNKQCNNHGIIQQNSSNGLCDNKCTCDDGWTGDYCERPSLCEGLYNQHNKCNGYGLIQIDSNSNVCNTSCTCYDPNWTGPDCTRPVQCETQYNKLNQCSQHGIIELDPLNTLQCNTICTCDSNAWTGPSCNRYTICEDIYNSLSQCNNSGIIDITIDSNTNQPVCNTICTCTNGQNTPNCIPYDPCLDEMDLLSQCHGHGIVQRDSDGICQHTCTCTSEWTGDDCIRPQQCENIYTSLEQCSGHGIVRTASPSSQQCNTICSCDDGWYGDQCNQTYNCSLYYDQITSSSSSSQPLPCSTYPNQEIYTFNNPNKNGYCDHTCICTDSALLVDCPRDRGIIIADNDTTTTNTNASQCSSQCTCLDGYYGDKCQHDTRCQNDIMRSDECNNHGTILYDNTLQQCQDICTCNANNTNDNDWIGVSCAQSKQCQNTAITLRCGTYGVVSLLQDTNQCQQTCSCLYGYTGPFCTNCNITCYRGGIENPKALCLDKYDNISPCICDTQKQKSFGRYCQYADVDTTITIRNRALPQWLLSSLSSWSGLESDSTTTNTTNISDNMKLFLSSLTKSFHNILGFDDDIVYTAGNIDYNTITNIYDHSNTKLYKNDIQQRVIIPLSSLSMGTTQCLIDDNTNDDDNTTTPTQHIINIPSTLTFRITTRVGYSISTLSKEANNIYSIWNRLLNIPSSSPNSIISILNNVMTQYNIDRIDSIPGCQYSSIDNDYTITPIVPDIKDDDNSQGNDDDSSNNTIDIYSTTTHVISIIISSIILSIFILL